MERTDWNGYLVTSAGEIFSKRANGKKLTPHPNHKGYAMVGVMVDGVLYKKAVHSIIAECFLGERPKGYQIDHIDNDKTNNRADNLQYITPSENVKKSYDSGNKDHSGFKASSSKYSPWDFEQVLVLSALGFSLQEVVDLTDVKRGTCKKLRNGTHFYCKERLHD